MNWITRKKLQRPGGQRGISLVETVIAVGILAFVGVAFLTTLTASSKATRLLDERVVVESLAREQMEYIKLAAYDNTPPIEYPVTVAVPAGYDVSIGVVVLDDGLQEITVSIKRGTNPLFALKDYKVDRQ